ncbi:hypothetical protein [Rubinisphaera italica]|uniref:Uncharacterized protein n=1 Tax=Rubinisphaera italica TaxID=2527969 RepID=A0A5C5XG52_9PLAN|nr:hypothetical protein [Rubinisphaera italica]TWT61639.1 hypothetical protein Pan54_23750 [Rubinisphaera italica]HBN75113.1 hypothetical protein [Planctomycetaceae bacterium]|tara:strand:- start:21 stop:311 length:291 start_codon:yes stop_codon:yes gene_type:complete
MAGQDYSRYQQKVIKRYYDNRDQIDQQKLSELVTSLYLATPKQAVKRWETAEKILERIDIPQSRLDHILKKKDPAILAAVVDELNKGIIKMKKTEK